MNLKGMFQITRVKIYHGIISFLVPIAILYPYIEWLDALLIFSTSFCILLATHVIDDINGYQNKTDILNAEQKNKIGEPKPLVSGRVGLYEAKILAVVLLLIAFCSAMILVFTNTGSLITLCLGFFTVFWAYSYAGAPLKLSYHGLGETVLVVCAGIMPVNITYYIMTGSFSAPVFILGLGLGILFASVLTASNMADVEGDIKTNRNTLSSIVYRRCGKFSVMNLHLGLMCIGFIIIFIGVTFLSGLRYTAPLIFISMWSVLLTIMKCDDFNMSRRITFYSYLSIVITLVIMYMIW